MYRNVDQNKADLLNFNLEQCGDIKHETSNDNMTRDFTSGKAITLRRRI